MRDILSKKMESYIFEKFNNSRAAKLRVTLLNNRTIFYFILCALHNSRTKLCGALSKCENKLKIGWEN